jgi:hypothetical protein
MLKLLICVESGDNWKRSEFSEYILNLIIDRRSITQVLPDHRSDHPGKHIFHFSCWSSPGIFAKLRAYVSNIAHELEMYNGCDKKNPI